MIITLEDLRNKKACVPGLLWFKHYFGEKTTLDSLIVKCLTHYIKHTHYDNLVATNNKLKLPPYLYSSSFTFLTWCLELFCKFGYSEDDLIYAINIIISKKLKNNDDMKEAILKCLYIISHYCNFKKSKSILCSNDIYFNCNGVKTGWFESKSRYEIRNRLLG